MASENGQVISIIREFLTRLAQEGIHVESAYLFGSYAKGHEDRWSDIDVAVISPDLTNDRLEERIRLMKLSSDIDTRIEPVPFRPDTFVDEDPLAWEIKRSGIDVMKADIPTKRSAWRTKKLQTG